jgi:hypothetical protein
MDCMRTRGSDCCVTRVGEVEECDEANVTLIGEWAWSGSRLLIDFEITELVNCDM